MHPRGESLLLHGDSSQTELIFGRTSHREVLFLRDKAHAGAAFARADVHRENFVRKKTLERGDKLCYNTSQDIYR